ncbi:hypothetical protein WMY93_019474 [Mugilogobius chulae]|uniref:Secreted protein n=1 Tax=Mugilogobius chulae TaxID=88201 RepID=A0AAW0NEG6_9GOBI
MAVSLTEWIPLILICMYPLHSCRRCSSLKRVGEPTLHLQKNLMRWNYGTLPFILMASCFCTRAPPSGLVRRGSWCCESGRQSPGIGYFPTPGSLLRHSSILSENVA